MSYEKELARIESIYHEHKGRYGYRRIHLTLKNEGISLNHKTVQRLMGLLNLKSTVRPKKYRSYRGDMGKTAPNYLNRNFTAAKPNEKWVTDVTEFKVNEQKVYLSPIIDLYNQEVVAYRVAKNTRLTLVMEMLKSGLSRLTKAQKPLLHSDQGWQYRNPSYQKLKWPPIIGSPTIGGHFKGAGFLFYKKVKLDISFHLNINLYFEIDDKPHHNGSFLLLDSVTIW
nr:IS3 family transposase [Providencia rettgeri]